MNIINNDDSLGPNIYRPRNPNIPFFPTHDAYNQRPNPVFPPGADPDRYQAWPVQPGIQSIEAYESIITKTLGSCQPLQKYICRCGVVQSQRVSQHGPASAAYDYSAREERDICFTLVTKKEAWALTKWMEQQDDLLTVISPLTATPFGSATLASSIFPERADGPADACKELGFGTEPSDYPRSALPPGVIPLSTLRIEEWLLPGVDGIARDGRATDDCGIPRIEW